MWKQRHDCFPERQSTGSVNSGASQASIPNKNNIYIFHVSPFINLTRENRDPHCVFKSKLNSAIYFFFWCFLLILPISLSWLNGSKENMFLHFWNFTARKTRLYWTHPTLADQFFHVCLVQLNTYLEFRLKFCHPSDKLQLQMRF